MQMSTTLILLIAVTLPALISGQQPSEPDWSASTCTRDEFAIRASAPDNQIGQLEVSDATGDYTIDTENNDETVVYTGCGADPALTYVGICDGTGDGAGTCESTLLVDITTPAQSGPGDFVASLDVCPANEESAGDDPKTFSKLVHWRYATVNTDMDGTNSLLNSLRVFRVTCVLPPKVFEVIDSPVEGNILVETLDTLEAPDVTVINPVVSLVMDNYNPSLGEDITLTVSFTDVTQFWKHLLVTDCSASNDNFAANEVVLLAHGCPQYDIDGKNLFSQYEYPITQEPSQDGPDEDVRKIMWLTFKAFRIGTLKRVNLKCSLRICPSSTQAVSCPLPQNVDVGFGTCDPVTPIRRYKQLMTRETTPDSFTSTLSTLILIESDTVIVDSEGTVAAGYTCLTTGTFAAVVAILCLLCLISITITITVCLQNRGRSNKSAVLDLPIGYNNYSIT